MRQRKKDNAKKKNEVQKRKCVFCKEKKQKKQKH